jgi:hypothetical protein
VPFGRDVWVSIVPSDDSVLVTIVPSAWVSVRLVVSDLAPSRPTVVMRCVPSASRVVDTTLRVPSEYVTSDIPDWVVGSYVLRATSTLLSGCVVVIVFEPSLNRRSYTVVPSGNTVWLTSAPAVSSCQDRVR